MKKDISHQKINEAKWDRWASAIDGKGWKYAYLRKAQEAVVNLLDLNPDTYLLDIGCGTGWALGKAAEKNLGQGVFYGVDLSPKMIEKAKAHFPNASLFHFIQASAEDIPLPDETFDRIICTNSFHHYLHPDRVLGEMYRLLKSSGKLYILDPTADDYFTKIINLVLKFVDPAHVNLYSTHSFRQMFREAGLHYLQSIQVLRSEKVHIGIKP
ncbi:MAG: class I SAM-dependent methyltransferase [Thermoflavifilum sp.]|nr:class I SAM-dependent methyltransferase [Thermoflavifilum sp.]